MTALGSPGAYAPGIPLAMEGGLITPPALIGTAPLMKVTSMSSEKILRLLSLILALLISVCIAIMCLFVPERRTALLRTF